MATSIVDKPDVSDGKLLRRFLGGDDNAFAELLGRYHRELWGFLARFTGDPTLAEDVFQETFLQVHLSAGMFDPARTFRPWLYAIAANKARDALRKRKRHSSASLDTAGRDGDQPSGADIIPADIPAPDENFVNLETRRAVQNMVNQLPDSLREVLILSYFQELPHKDISRITDIPVGTVKSRLHRAVGLFAERWKTWAEKTNMI